jgi:hypothetical protein
MTALTVSTLTNGNVIVATQMSNGQLLCREYKRRGSCVYLVRDQGPPMPVCRGLRTTGEQLLIRKNESLEQAVRRALEEQDGKARRMPFDVKVMWFIFAAAVAWSVVVAAMELAKPIGIVR